MTGENENDNTQANTKRSFSSLIFPARPQTLISTAKALAYRQINVEQALTHRLGPPKSINWNYIKWLEKESMLNNGRKQALRYSGQAAMWQNPYAKARPRAAVKKASVWYTAYPVSTITKEKHSILRTLGEPKLWQAFQEIGIHALHTGPMKQAGGLDGWSTTPSIDGHFDRISARIDGMFGTEAEFREMGKTAAQHGGIIIDDIIPGHTGKGADFRLAEMHYDNYPGIYHMIQITEADWHLLPDVPPGKDAVNIDPASEARLKKAGYIIGKLQRILFYEPGVKETNWSATKVVRGVDGIRRRWVYLHYFKAGQPTINWLDPSFAGMELVVGDALHSLGDLGSTGLRLDANGFLGVEVNGDEPAWSEGHPLSLAANQLIAGMVRKMGGFTFQELNLSFDHMYAMSSDGPDLSYDFISRPAYHHALATANTEFLRLAMNESLKIGIDPAALVHGLQNHDELTLELVHYLTLHSADIYQYHGKTITGTKLRDKVREEILAKVIPPSKYNLASYGDDGISCTTTSLIAAAMGYETAASIDDAAIEKIKKAHLLLVMYNALQPGVFALSGWDLSGAFTLSTDSIADLLADGDTRWINRGAYDLMGENPEAKASAAGMPKARSLYGSLPEQLKDPKSFARQMQKLLADREACGIAVGRQLDVPPVAHPGLLVMVHQLPDDAIQATVLNFSAETVDSEITSSHLPKRATATDSLSDEVLGTVSEHHSLPVNLLPYGGISIVFENNA